VLLQAVRLPPAAVGYFLTSRTQGNTQQPAGSVGVFCLSGFVGRFIGPGQVQASSASGALELQLDLTGFPAPQGFVAVTAGETWNFQLWHRDSQGGVATSNFTDGLSIDFN
jgi:hypothetical protein